MPVSKKTEEFLRYATENLKKGKDAKISNKDKVFAPYIINEYTTWGQLYDAAVKEFKAQGGNELEIGKMRFGPNYKLPTGSPFAMTTQQANLDPLASAVDSNNLRVTTDDNGNSTLRANVGDGSVEHYLYVRQRKDRFGKPTSEVIIRTDFDEIANIAISDYKSKPGGIDALFESLYKKKIISKETYNSKNISDPGFRKGLQYVIRQYGVSSVDARTFDKKLTVDTLDQYLSSNALSSGASGESNRAKNLPVRDINLVDRDVVKAVIKDVYFNELQKEVDSKIIDAKTDYYMKQIESGTLTTVKEGSKEVTRTTTPGFSQERIVAELQPKVKKEFTEDYNQAQSINFLSFLSDLGAR